MWRTDAWPQAKESAPAAAKTRLYLGSVESDRADYGRAVELLEQASELAGDVGEPRRRARCISRVATWVPRTTTCSRRLHGHASSATRAGKAWHGHPDTAAWIETMRAKASRHGMRELTVRAMLRASSLGNNGHAAAAVLLAADIDNPVLRDAVGALV